MRLCLRLAAAASIPLAATCVHAAEQKDSVLTYKAPFFADQRPNTAYDMIGRLPGFAFVNGNSARGFAGSGGNVLIDGERPTSKSDDLQSILQRIPASDVDHIDVIRGGAQGIDMQGQTVVANVVRRKGASTQWVLQLSDNVFQDGHTVPGASLDFTRHDGDRTFEGSLTRYASFDDSVGYGFHKTTDLTTGKERVQTAKTAGQGSGGAITGAATLPLWDGTLRANLALQDSPFHSVATYFGTTHGRYVNDDSVNRNAELGLHWSGKRGNWEYESLVLQRVGFSKDVNALFQANDDEVFRSSSTTGESIARQTVRYSWNDALTIESGAEAAYNFLDGDTAFVLNGVGQVLPDAKAHVDERRGEAFGQATWKIAPEWMLEAGARLEYSTIGEKSETTRMSRSFFYPKPRAVLTWSPTAADQVRLRYEKVVGQLDFGNFIATSNLGGSGVSSGNSDLRPDQRSQYEISYEHHFWNKGAVTLQFIHEQITDVVDLVKVQAPDGSYFNAPGNIGEGRNEQINAQIALPLDRIGLVNGLLKVTSDFQLSSVRDPVTEENRVITAERPQDIEVNLTQDIESLKSTWGVYYFNGWDEKYFRLAQTQHRKVVPPYIEVFWEYKPAPGWSYHIGFINLGQFVYDNRFFDYDGPRDTGKLVLIDERSIRSQPRVYLELRKTF
ncbi:MAG TPA: TonB-dependent receptor [Rhizomicrobium sp.]|nr:TonB-dependent receptor [Rhizomicrobium sp.]